MSIGIVTESEFTSELEKFTPSANKPNQTTIHEQIEHGRNKHDNNVPNELRKSIQDDVMNGVKSDVIEKVYGISSSSISAYKHGSTSTKSYHQPNSDLLTNRHDVKLRISSRAKSKLLLAIKHISEDKLQHAKVRDLAGIAKDMSTVVKNMDDNNVITGTNQQNFIFYAPRNKDSDSYEIIEVNK